jgi:hypothetical protein
MNKQNQTPGQKPRLSVASSTLAGVAVGAGVLAAVGAGAGFASEALKASVDATTSSVPSWLTQLTPVQGAIGGAAIGAAVGGLSGYASGDRARREAELLPDRGRRESWQERVIRQRALAAARAAEAQQGTGGSTPSRA